MRQQAEKTRSRRRGKVVPCIRASYPSDSFAMDPDVRLCDAAREAHGSEEGDFEITHAAFAWPRFPFLTLANAHSPSLLGWMPPNVFVDV
ncbi:hypothetical protein J1614_000983 [Plenodomus biglobosus]|nr:hypothetical protein J1614_000983 [Plenodomus biglobosus]